MEGFILRGKESTNMRAHAGLLGAHKERHHLRDPMPLDLFVAILFVSLLEQEGHLRIDRVE